MTRIICLEGITGAGKTTQARKVGDCFAEKGYKYLTINEKLYSPFKEMVLNWHNTGANQRFSKKEVLEFARARAETHKQHFYPLFEEMDYLIFDRSLYFCQLEILDHFGKGIAKEKGYGYILRVISRNKNVGIETLRSIAEDSSLEKRYREVAIAGLNFSNLAANNQI